MVKSSMVIMFLLTLPTVIAQSSDGDIHFQVTEQIADMHIGNIKTSESVRAFFSDSTSQEELRFELTPSPDQDETLFDIEGSSGDMKTAMAIDREEHCPGEELCFLYIDVGVIYQGSIQPFTVRIEILDVNDFIPYFDSPEVTYQIPENAPTGTGRSLPLARDLDSPRNGVNRYELLTNSNIFDLEQTGSNIANRGLRIVLRRNLDREIQSAYTLQIAAYDSNDITRRGNFTVHIEVLDENDNAPVFTNTSLTLHIAEDLAPGTLIAIVHATDPDVGDNSRLTYEFSSNSIDSYEGKFSIDENNGKIYIQEELDYEMKNTYNFEITARDSGIEPQSSTIPLIIFLQDINDNPPDITINTFQPSNEAYVNESAPIGRYLAHVRVFDADHSGNNKRTSCVLDHPAFALQPFQNTDDQYNIYTNTTFDREVEARYTVLIECHDFGQPSLDSYKTFIVNIIDENDNPPVLRNREYEVYVNENNEIDAVLLTLDASDADQGINAELTYSVTSTDILNYVYLESATGVLRARVQFDYEQLTFLRFEVHVKDNGLPSRETSANVTLRIVDANDYAPTFTQSQFVFLFEEEQAVAQFIGQVVAEDRDGEPYNRFIYSIHSQEAVLPFEINPDTGVIVSTSTFNREVQDSYLFEVKVTDMDNPAFFNTAQVVVEITDINDNTPYFIFPDERNNSISISNQVPLGTAIFAIQASDRDIGQNANVTFQLVNPTSREHHFRISNLWGTVTTDADFREINYQEYNVRLTIRDQGQPFLDDTRMFTIVVDSRVAYSGTIVSETKPEDDDEGGSNTVIIGAVSAVSVLLVLSLIGAILFIKLRERRKPVQKKLNDEPYDAERKDIDGPLTPTDSMSITSGRSSPLSSIDSTCKGGVSYHPTGTTTLPQGLEIIDSKPPNIAPDNVLLYDKKLTQKPYLTQNGDHDTSSSTEDSGRGASEEGTEVAHKTNRDLHRESQGATPEIIADSRLPVSKPLMGGYTMIPHPSPNSTTVPSYLSNNNNTLPRKAQVLSVDVPRKPASMENYPMQKPSSLANPRNEAPPSYGSFLRQKSGQKSKRKNVKFALDGVTVSESGTDQLANDMQYPLSSSNDNMHRNNSHSNVPFKTQPKPLRSSLKKTATVHRYNPASDNSSVHSDGYQATRPPRPSIDSDHSFASVIV